MEDRIQKAVELFKSGYNCSQSVVAAFADMYGFTQEQALRMSASFGGGVTFIEGDDAEPYEEKMNRISCTDRLRYLILLNIP